MAKGKMEKQIVVEISKYRTICLIHRYLYYVKHDPLIGDYEYDMFEKKLKKLVEENPRLAFEAENQAFCPVSNVGSDNPDDYPRRIEQLAEDLLVHKGDHGKATVSDVPVLPSTSYPSEKYARERGDVASIPVPIES